MSYALYQLVEASPPLPFTWASYSAHISKKGFRFSNGPTAVALKRVGVGALVLEKSEGLRATGAALGLHPNAWLALDALGVSHKLTTTYAPCRKRNVTNVDTGATQQVPSAKPDKNGHELRIYSTS
nr:hypothetical protein CFP56_55528 [Quercus suber]